MRQFIHTVATATIVGLAVWFSLDVVGEAHPKSQTHIVMGKSAVPLYGYFVAQATCPNGESATGGGSSPWILPVASELSGVGTGWTVVSRQSGFSTFAVCLRLPSEG